MKKSYDKKKEPIKQYKRFKQADNRTSIIIYHEERLRDLEDKTENIVMIQ